MTNDMCNMELIEREKIASKSETLRQRSENLRKNKSQVTPWKLINIF